MACNMVDWILEKMPKLERNTLTLDSIVDSFIKKVAQKWKFGDAIWRGSELEW